jgi:hypothetical protein
MRIQRSTLRRLKAIGKYILWPLLSFIAAFCMSIGVANSQEDCKLLRPSAEAEIIFMGAFQGGALSTVTVAGFDSTTSIVSIEVEDGNAPFYVFVVARSPVIWKLSGAVDRIESFPVEVAGTDAGVIGLPKDKITFARANDCGVTYALPSQPALTPDAVARLELILDRKVSVHLGVDRRRPFKIPTGKINREYQYQSHAFEIIRRFASKDADFEVRPLTELDLSEPGEEIIYDPRDMLERFFPMELMDIKPAEVVASGKVERYDLLPSTAGLLQLLAAGVLKERMPRQYLIQKPMKRFPVDLLGSAAVTFILPGDLEMPGGDPGHSSVYSAETGACLIKRCYEGPTLR